MHLDMVFKAFVGILAAVVIIGSGLGVVSAFSQTIAADNYLETVAKVIVESNYSEDIIDDCIDEAAQNGYSLEVDVIRSAKAGMKSYATVEMTYYFEIPLFGIRQEKIQIKMI